MAKPKELLRLLRPFTLLAPGVGGFFFGLMGLHDAGKPFLQYLPLLFLSGFLLAMTNAMSNILNQIYDADIDAQHPTKKLRPIPFGSVTVHEALTIVVFLNIVIILGAALFFGISYVLSLSLIMLFAWLYNCPPARMKKRLLWSNVAIAAPRGGLGITCAYSAFASPFNPIMYVAIFYFALYVFGTNTLKDFADEEYDKKAGVRNFVTVLGQEKAKEIVGLFLVVPWFFLLAVNCFIPLSMLNFIPLMVSGAMIGLMFRQTDKKSVEGNSLLWVLFYLQFSLMMVLFALPRIL